MSDTYLHISSIRNRHAYYTSFLKTQTKCVRVCSRSWTLVLRSCLKVHFNKTVTYYVSAGLLKVSTIWQIITCCVTFDFFLFFESLDFRKTCQISTNKKKESLLTWYLYYCLGKNIIQFEKSKLGWGHPFRWSLKILTSLYFRVTSTPGTGPGLLLPVRRNGRKMVFVRK